MSRSGRRWYAGPLLIATTVSRTFETLKNHRLAPFIPIVGLLLLGAIVLWIVNTIAPLAPFVYSLF